MDDTGYISPLVVSALQKAVEDELASKGFREIQSEGDSDIELSLVLRTRRELVSYEQGPNPCRDNDCWEVIDPGSNVRMDLRTTGFLAADIYVQNQPVWRGWVETTLYPKDRDAAGEVIARAIPKLFESFPP